jgi:GT2 family glycosyltransferase
MKISVVIPTHNRQEQIIKTVETLRRQDFPADEYEIIVVDDGSKPPVSLPPDLLAAPKVSLIRLEGVERSITRNTGAKNANGELLVFIDDDISVNADFLKNYRQADQDFPNALFVGEILLPEESLKTPFGRFRQKLERNGVPTKRGEVPLKTFCAAGNMAVRRTIFEKLSGFDIVLTSSEDQDFALRHTSGGGKIVFIPEAIGIHHDSALNVAAYCRRNEWGSRLMRQFYQRYPNLSANIERERVNGKINWKNDSASAIARKIIKSVLALPPVVKTLFFVTETYEKLHPESSLLERAYSLLLGIHIFRGYRTATRSEVSGKSKST